MKTPSRTRKAGRGRSNLAPLVLIGAGLILVGLVGFILLARPGESKTQENQEASLPSAVPMAVDAPAPELALTDLKGEAVAVSDFRGQWVLLNNWATWCPPCKAEMPTLQAFYEDHSEKGFTIIAIDAGDPVADVAQFVKDYGLSFPVWADLTQKATVAFRNPGLPSSYLIDRQGVVRLAWTGAISRGMLDQYVTPLLDE